MEAKYIVLNIIDTEKIRAERRRRRILRRRIKSACSIIGFLSFFYLFGIVGGLEQDLITIKQFIANSLIALSLMWVSMRVHETI